MAKSRNQKGKILVLEHLLQGTGESRIVTMQEILDKLLEYGITAERKSIYDDIEALREFGLDVQYKRGRPGGYYLAGEQEIAAAPVSYTHLTLPRKLLRHRSQFTQKRKQGFQKMQRQKKNQNQ